MSFFTKLFTGQRRKKGREEIHPFHNIRVRIADVEFKLTDYSASGLSCDRDSQLQTPFPFEVDQIIGADFLIYSHRKASTRVKIMWKDEKSFGAKVVDTDSFQVFASQYLTYVKSK